MPLYWPKIEDGVVAPAIINPFDPNNIHVIPCGLKSDVIIFGGIPYDKRGRSLGPFRVRSIVEKMQLNM